MHVSAHRTQRRGLCLAAPLGDGLGEVREQHRQPQPDRNREDEAGRPVVRELSERRADADDRREDAADEDHEHHRIADLHPRIELAKRIGDRAAHDLPVTYDTGARARGRRRPASEVPVTSVSLAWSCMNSSAFANHLQVLDDRTERERGHERQRADHQDDTHQHA